MTDEVPFKPTCGRVLVRQVPYKPSQLIQIVNGDNAFENEGIVVALSPYRHGRKTLGIKSGTRRGETVMTDQVFEHDVKVGDRVIFKGKYLDDDTLTFNGVKHRCLDPWDIMGVLEAERPDGYINAATGEHIPERHPILVN